MDFENEMDMPTPCQNCGKWFDLHDGCGSQKWFPNTMICESCFDKEEEEIERDEEIQELKEDIEEAQDDISDAEFKITEAKKRLLELGVEYKLEE